MVEEYQAQQDPEDYYEDLMDEQQDYPLDYPQAKPSESMFALFHRVLRLKDNSKTANLDIKTELGDLHLTVRDCQKINLLSDALHHQRFGQFFNGLGEITLRTSASKKGWFTELFVSQKRLSTKTQMNIAPPQQQKTGWFRKKKPQMVYPEQQP